MTPMRFSVLARVDEDAQSFRIARNLGLGKKSVSSSLQQLRMAGLVTFSSRWILTDAGRETIAKGIRPKNCLCSVEGCTKPAWSKGFCGAHYKTRPDAPRCTIDECDRPAVAYGLCSSHNNKRRRHGDPLAGRQQNGAIELEISLIAATDVDECVIWPFGLTTRGYAVWGSGEKRIPIHREICRIVHGEPPSPDLHAAHSCGKGHLGCVNPKHLRWATAAENAADRTLHGTQARGEQVNTAKLKPHQVLLIRETARQGVTNAEQGRRLGMSGQQIGDIVAGRKWKHLPV